MAEKKVVQETLKRLRKPYVKYDGVVRPTWEKNGASGAYKELCEIIPELGPRKSKKK
jgi:hypothetical protein